MEFQWWQGFGIVFGRILLIEFVELAAWRDSTLSRGMDWMDW